MRRIAMFAALLLALAPPAGAADAVPAGEHRSLALEQGAGRVLNLAAPAVNLFVADPRIAEVRPASATSLFVFGLAPGRTSLAAMDGQGHLVVQYEVTVSPGTFDAGAAEAAIAKLMPGTHVRVQPEPKGLLLSGAVDNAEDATQAVAIAHDFLAGTQVVDNQLRVRASLQVMLRVRIAEVSRDVLQNLGINWQALGSIGNIGKLPALSLNTNAATLPLCAAGAAFSIACQGLGFSGVVDALVQDNLARILAEPNLTVTSGQPASFLVGGEFPIPVGQEQGQVTIEFKKYGVTLSFLPTVYSDGRINLHVAPEVSELTNQGAVQLTAGNSTIQVPALLVRRAETTVELGSGQSFAIAGLLEDALKVGPSGLPYMSNLPILGPLFRSDSFQRDLTELVIVVTPVIARPVDDASKLRLPTDGVRDAGDLGRLMANRQIAPPPVGGAPVGLRLPGDAGFIVQ